MSTKKVTTIHSLAELPAELLVGNHKASDNRNIKSVVGQPLVILSAKAVGKEETAGYRLTCYLTSDPDVQFSLHVYSQQPRAVLAAMLDGDLFPMGAQFQKSAGRYLLASA